MQFNDFENQSDYTFEQWLESEIARVSNLVRGAEMYSTQRAYFLGWLNSLENARKNWGWRHRGADWRKTCSCTQTTGQTWCCNLCGLPSAKK